MKRPAAASNRARTGPAARAAAADNPAARAAAASDLHLLERKAKAEMMANADMEEASAWSDSDAETLKFGGARSADEHSPTSFPDYLRQPTSPALRSPEPNWVLKQFDKIRQLAGMDKGDLKAKGNKDDDKEEDAGQERKRMRSSSSEPSLAQLCQAAVRHQIRTVPSNVVIALPLPSWSSHSTM